MYVPVRGEDTAHIDSWICDFLMHGKLSLLRKDNLLVGAEAWTAVNDVIAALRLMRNVLKKVATPDDIVLLTITDLQKELKARLAAENA